MRKKLMAVAVVTALSAPAAALAQVTIGGGINLLYFSHNPDNNSSGQTSDVMQSSESELTIRGEEKLGGGMSTWFQCGTSIDGIFNGNTAGVAGMCTRNSGLGFTGSFGNIFAGNWDTPEKLVANKVRGWFSGTNALYGGGFTLMGNGAASGQANGVGGSTSAAGSGGSATSFYRRQANSVNYHSPNWSGFSLAAAFSAANETVSTPDSSSLNPRLYGINGKYEAGPFWVAAAYESHSDYNPGQVAAATYTGDTDNSVLVGVGYTFAGKVNVRAGFQQNKYNIGGSTAATSGDLKTKAYSLYADWNIAGPHTVRAAYIALSDISGSALVGVGSYAAPNTATGSVNSTGANVATLVYSYAFSKRTELSVAYDQLSNDDNAKLGMGVVAATFGNKQTSVGIAIRHTF